MRAFIPLLRRQLLSYCWSPGTYIVMAAFLAVSGLGFSSMMFRSLLERIDPAEILFGSALFWIASLGVITLITMRLIAEEKQSGTLETLLTAPITDTEFVIAKYLGALVFFTVLSACAILIAGVIVFFNSELVVFNLFPLIMGYLMFLLVSGFYLAYGLFLSSLTSNQLVAGILCFSGICLAAFFEVFHALVPCESTHFLVWQVPGARSVLEFSRGVIYTSPLIFYFSGIIFFLFATVKVIESRLWK